MAERMSGEMEPLSDDGVDEEIDAILDSEAEAEPIVVDDDDEDVEKDDLDDDDDEAGDDEDAVAVDDEVDIVEEEEDLEPEEPVFEEEAGYRDSYDWSSFSEEDRGRHVALLESTSEELESVSFKKLNPLDRWAVAQAYARNRMRESFQEACRSILKARKKHDGLMYEDIYLELISDLADSEQYDEAFEYLEKFFKAFEHEEAIYHRVNGLLLIESGKIHEGRKILDDLMAKADDHGELHLELGDDLLAMGHPELALSILGRGKDFARRANDTELMTAIDETRRMAISEIDGDE